MRKGKKVMFSNPDEEAIRFYMSKKEHNRLFPRRKQKWFRSYQYYMSPYRIELRTYLNIFGKITNTLFMPIVILLEGLQSIPELFKDCYKIWFQEKTKTYVCDYATSGSDVYKEIKMLLEKEREHEEAQIKEVDS